MAVRADNRLADMPMRPVICRGCGAELLVRKGSRGQTSVQWDARSTASCAERRRAEQLPGRIFLICGQLKESIAAEVADGRLPVVDETSVDNVIVDEDLRVLP